MDSARYNFQTDTHTYTPHKASQSRLVQSCAYVAGARGQVTQLAYLIAGSALFSFIVLDKQTSIFYPPVDNRPVVSAQLWLVCNRHLLESINPTVRSCLQQAHIFSAKTGFSNSCILSTKGMPPSETGV
ncbi:hypothetical protein T03_16891 [Trichinella britovi]|uniref:Uncharacterized protein n=1 Tax=Trichinella britovi TaxID=45882 RepID=A0A0V1CEK6_TRIBR|nr:hypothetical protein T03_16891 [Trichinella britovi]